MPSIPIKRWLLPAIPLGLAGAACALCCSVPLAAALGLGATGGFASEASVGEPLALAILGVSVVGGALFLQRRRAAGSCATTAACEVDGSCGCGGALRRNADGQRPATSCAASCTLDERGISARLDEFQSLFAKALVRRERTNDGFVWVLRHTPTIEAEARALAAKELACCAFFQFDLRVQSGELRWHVSTSPADRPMLDRLYESSDGYPPASRLTPA